MPLLNFIYITLVKSMHTVDIYESLKTLPHNLHYVDRYFKFIRACMSQQNLGYVEHHHILPKSMFPQFSDLGEHVFNSARLTGRQHFIAHWMLAKAYGGKMWSAFWMMCNRVDQKVISSKVYEVTKKQHSATHGQYLKDLYANNPELKLTMSHVGERNGFFGKKHTEETLAKLRGRIVSKETREKISASRTGVTQSEETIKKRVVKTTGKKRSPEQIKHMSACLVGIPKAKVACIHCGAMASQGNITRWHNDNCKSLSLVALAS